MQKSLHFCHILYPNQGNDISSYSWIMPILKVGRNHTSMGIIGSHLKILPTNIYLKLQIFFQFSRAEKFYTFIISKA